MKPPAPSTGEQEPAQRRVVLITGLSGSGKASTLRVLEDLGYEAVDNPPLPLMEEMVIRGERPAAICVDTRSRGFDPDAILNTLARLKCNPGLRPELVFVQADETSLLRRFTETRRRHPLAPTSRVSDGIAAEIRLIATLRDAADLVLDTTDLSLPMLRRIIEQRFSGNSTVDAGMTVSLISFAYPAGLPREAELVFDARFLRNPHYDPILRSKTGLDDDVAAYVEADPDFLPFMDKMTDLLALLLPRFVQEGKKYAGVAIGCTGGRHRSVRSIEMLAERLRTLQPPGGGGADRPQQGRQGLWRVVVTHRELMRGGLMRSQADSAGRVPGSDGGNAFSEQQGAAPPAQAPSPGAGGLKDIP